MNNQIQFQQAQVNTTLFLQNAIAICKAESAQERFYKKLGLLDLWSSQPKRTRNQKTRSQAMLEVPKLPNPTKELISDIVAKTSNQIQAQFKRPAKKQEVLKMVVGQWDSLFPTATDATFSTVYFYLGNEIEQNISGGSHANQ